MELFSFIGSLELEFAWVSNIIRYNNKMRHMKMVRPLQNGPPTTSNMNAIGIKGNSGAYFMFHL
jgi:hypothetical protein